MKPEIELAQLVMDWSKIDDDVAAHGWDGGERDGEWDNCKNAMVSVAHDILDGDYRPKQNDMEMKLCHGNGKDGIVGIGFTVRPAYGGNEGYVEMRMIASDTCVIKKNALLPIRLYFLDLCAVLTVFDGIEMSAVIQKRSSTLPVSRSLSIRHNVEKVHGFVFSLTTDMCSMEGEDAWKQEVEFMIDVCEAVGLREVLRHAMLLVGCGLPSAMRKAGE